MVASGWAGWPHGKIPGFLVQLELVTKQILDQECLHSVRQADNGTTTLLLMRHAEVHNPEDILYGRLPRFGLSELGKQQAEVTARALAEEPISTFYTSPQLRARQTARILAAPHPGATLS